MLGVYFAIYLVININLLLLSLYIEPFVFLESFNLQRPFSIILYIELCILFQYKFIIFALGEKTLHEVLTKIHLLLVVHYIQYQTFIMIFLTWIKHISHSTILSALSAKFVHIKHYKSPPFFLLIHYKIQWHQLSFKSLSLFSCFFSLHHSHVQHMQTTTFTSPKNSKQKSS